MFPYLTTDILSIIWCRAETDAPKEAVGLLVGKIWPQDQAVMVFDQAIPLMNEAQDPARYFSLYTLQLRGIQERRERGELLALWHSHPDKGPALSREDQNVMWALKIPMLVVSVPQQVAVMYTYLAPRHDGKRPIVEWGKWVLNERKA